MPFGSCVRGLLAPTWCICRWLLGSSTGYRYGWTEAGRIATPFRDRAVARRDEAPNTFPCIAPDRRRNPARGLVSSRAARPPPGYLYVHHPGPGSRPLPHPQLSIPSHPAPALRAPAPQCKPPGPRTSTDPNPRRHTYCTKEWRRSAYRCMNLPTFAHIGAASWTSRLVTAMTSDLSFLSPTQPVIQDISGRPSSEGGGRCD